MAFTNEQVDNMLGSSTTNIFFFNGRLADHNNYKIVKDYLTGESSSLNGLLPIPENMALQMLPIHLENIDPPSQNDQLIIDVLMHPDIFPFVQHAFAEWLIYYAANNNTASGISTSVAKLKAIGYTADQIFFQFIQTLQSFRDRFDELLSTTSEIKKYLLNSIPAQVSNWKIYNNHWSYSYHWNVFLFLLLEESSLKLVESYVIYGLTQDHADTKNYIFEYKNGKYIPAILSWLNTVSISLEQFEARLLVAIRLYEKNPQLFQQPLFTSVRQYLGFAGNNKTPDRWENQLNVKLVEGENTARIGYSAAALHYLILDNPDEAKEIVHNWFRSKVPVSFDMLQILFFHFKQEVLAYFRLGLKTDASLGGIEYYRKIMALLTKEFEPSDYIGMLWELVSSKSKPLREEIAKLLAEKDKGAEQKAVLLLKSKSAETRQTVALVLSFFNTQNAIHAVKEMLHAETNDNARDILLKIAEASLPAKANNDFVNEMVQAAGKRKKLEKPVEAWLNETDLPALFYQSGQQLSALEIRFLFYRMSRVKAMRSDVEAKYVIDLLDKDQSALFAKHIVQLFIDKGAKPEHKYLMALAAMLGNDETVEKLKRITNEWIEAYRTKMAEYGIGALALQGGNKALRTVEYYSRKYKNKTASVGVAALQALEDAAEELGISTHELGDRIVPDFGFDELFKSFTVDGVEYRAFVDSNFKLAYFDEDNKKLKALPAAAGKEIKEEFKSVVKEIRDVVKSQSLRLEHYLVTQRRWSSKEWQTFYLTNPVMFIYATKLLWGRYDHQNNLLDCFICQDDTSLTNMQDDELELGEKEQIGIVHPIQMNTDKLDEWKRKLYDLSIITIFPQLDRNIAVVEEKHKQNKISYQFNDMEAESGAIKSTLEKYGWRKGVTGDGGYLDHFIYENRNKGIEAILEVEGVFAGGFNYDSEPKLGRLYFVNKKKEKTRWFIFPKDEQDERLIALGDVDEIFYSEVVGSIGYVKRKEKKAALENA